MLRPRTSGRKKKEKKSLSADTEEQDFAHDVIIQTEDMSHEDPTSIAHNMKILGAVNKGEGTHLADMLFNSICIQVHVADTIYVC